MSNKHIGSTLDSLFEELGKLEEVEQLTKERVEQFDKERNKIIYLVFAGVEQCADVWNMINLRLVTKDLNAAKTEQLKLVDSNDWDWVEVVEIDAETCSHKTLLRWCWSPAP